MEKAASEPLSIAHNFLMRELEAGGEIQGDQT